MARTIQISEPFNLASDIMTADKRSSDVTATTPSYYHGSRADLDDCISSAIQRLELVRQAMTAIAAKHPISNDALADLVDEAQAIINGATFTVKRFYHDKEEGLRTAREREYAALEEQKPGCFSRRVKRIFIKLRYDLGGTAASMAAGRDDRIRKLQYAMDKVERHRLLVQLEGGTAPY